MRIVSILAAILVLFLIIGCTPVEEKGTLVMQITDAPADLNIEKALVTISEVQVHVAGEDNEEVEDAVEPEVPETSEETETTEEVEEETKAGWFTVVAEEQTFDLMELVNVVDVLGQAELDTGKYAQVRLTLKEAKVTIDGEEHNLEVPSGKIKLVKGFDILAGETTTLTLDFDAQQSVIATGNGEYKLKPTIKILSEEETKDKMAKADEKKPEDAGAQEKPEDVVPEDKGKPADVGQAEN